MTDRRSKKEARNTTAASKSAAVKALEVPSSIRLVDVALGRDALLKGEALETEARLTEDAIEQADVWCSAWPPARAIIWSLLPSEQGQLRCSAEVGSGDRVCMSMDGRGCLGGVWLEGLLLVEGTGVGLVLRGGVGLVVRHGGDGCTSVCGCVWSGAGVGTVCLVYGRGCSSASAHPKSRPPVPHSVCQYE